MTGHRSAQERRLYWPDCHNVRDLGGLRTADGCHVRPGALVRADDLGRLTPAGFKVMDGYGIRRVIDLRASWEIARNPSPFAADAVYRWAPLIDEQADRDRDLVAEATLAATYRGSVGRNARNIAAAIAAIADAPSGGVLVYCSAGKDRTGMIVALALRAADVRLDDVVADYAFTSDCLREHFDAQLALVTDPVERETRRGQQSSPPTAIAGMLQHVEDAYGGVTEYLRAHGVSREQIITLRRRLRTG
ncbi:MAG TPA: tyrosine-protein phosphatase [Planosporangium sp.]|jgi:protein tyrosine/serine phosphatase|nr:tyrosine-protein phosphatase [Planosporangium sp.]